MKIRPHDGAAILWLALLLAITAAAPLLAPADPRQPVGPALTPPGPGTGLGTDALGRDLWSRMVFGSRVSLTASLGAALISVVIGAAAGLVSATAAKAIDAAIGFAANAALAVPGLLLALLLVAGLGPGLPAVVLSVGLAGIPGFTRVARTLFLQARQGAFIAAASALGAGPSWLATRHLLPNSANNLLALAGTQVAWSFIGITTLTFLGLAGDPSLPEWGVMLNAGRVDLISAPWLSLIPGTAICLTILAVYTLAEWLGRVIALPGLTRPPTL